MKLSEIINKSKDEVIQILEDKIIGEYENKIKDLPEEIVNDFEKVIALRVIDTHWMEHINTMDHLKEGIGLRSYAQTNPLVAYTNEGFDLFDEMLEKISTIQIALAGVTDSLNEVDTYSFLNRSVLKTFDLKPSGTIDDEIEDYLHSVKEYEKYHTIYMDRDKEGNDNSIHAYIETPKNGLLRSTFDKDLRLNAKRNNIKYWIDDYKISSGSSGGKFVRPLGHPIEIM